MIREQIKADLKSALRKLDSSVVRWSDGQNQVEVTRASDARFGDFSTNIALTISHQLKQSPMRIAKKLADSLQNLPYIKKLEVKEPGFINFFVKDQIWQEEVSAVIKSDKKYGSNSAGKGKTARVEFVSANPTGPLHFGNARGGPIGDSLASVLGFSGYKVVREYLHNDVGGQVKKLGESIVKVKKGEKLADQEYKGWYVEDLAREIKADDTDEAGRQAVKKMLDVALKNCEKLGIKFDEIYSESEFASSGQTKADIDHLREKGTVVEKDGALWFAPSDEFLKDRETVVVKSDGEFTYFADDIAYHDEKFKNNPDLVIDIFGADHHGHVPRLQAAISALGHDVSKFKVILYQWVRFKKGEEILKTSKRSGNIVTVADVLSAIGPDAVRFFILMHDPNSPIDFDLELAKKKSRENPVYYVQYAHARIASILAKAKIGSRFSVVSSQTVNSELLTDNHELQLIKQISRLPELVEDISQNFAVHGLTAYARELADSFHKFYENCPVLTEKPDLKSARLALCKATQIALSNSLTLLGVSAPQKM